MDEMRRLMIKKKNDNPRHYDNPARKKKTFLLTLRLPLHLLREEFGDEALVVRLELLLLGGVVRLGIEVVG